ncbi:YppG family protein [Bacillus sp. P14.5]|uniref:YppG family protein n=1 Tax=Bacillus sp. P14.5 TaxID=1983400 RepID=UPI001F0688F7|nr:YppG family protein [Bacillus sp. P14.5]
MYQFHNHYQNWRIPARRYYGHQQQHNGAMPYPPYGSPQQFQQPPYLQQPAYGYNQGYQNPAGDYGIYSQGNHYANQYFQNPLQPDEINHSQGGIYNDYQGMMNPYPKGSFMAKPQSSGMGTIMKSFKSQDGSLDFNKMMNTAGQMMNAMSQVSSMVKGVGGFFKV